MVDLLSSGDAVKKVLRPLTDQEIINQRRWAVIKADAPELAEALICINKVFGAPKIISVELSSGYAFDDTQPVDVVWDGKLRRKYGER